MNSQILVTGAAGGSQGGTGRELTKMLAEARVPVRAFVHREDYRAEQLRAIGAEVVVGDLLQIKTVRAAMKGIEEVFFCFPVGAGLLEATAIVAQVAKEEKARFILNLSQGAASDESPSPVSRQHWLSERIFDWSEIPVFHLRGGVFFENLFRQLAKGIRENSELRAPFGSGDGRIPALAGRDVSRFAAAAMQDPKRLAGKTFHVFTVVLSLNELAKQLSGILGRPIHYREVTFEDWMREAETREGNQNPQQLEHLVNLWRGLLMINQRPEVASKLQDMAAQVKNVAGFTPTTLHEWLKINDAKFQTIEAK